MFVLLCFTLFDVMINFYYGRLLACTKMLMVIPFIIMVWLIKFVERRFGLDVY